MFRCLPLVVAVSLLCVPSAAAKWFRFGDNEPHTAMFNWSSGDPEHRLIVADGKLTNADISGVTYPVFLTASGCCDGWPDPEEPSLYYFQSIDLGTELATDLVTVTYDADLPFESPEGTLAPLWNRSISFVPQMRDDGTYARITLDNVWVPEPPAALLACLCLPALMLLRRQSKRAVLRK